MLVESMPPHSHRIRINTTPSLTCLLIHLPTSTLYAKITVALVTSGFSDSMQSKVENETELAVSGAQLNEILQVDTKAVEAEKEGQGLCVQLPVIFIPKRCRLGLG